jgi:hypothetical protein
MLRTIATCIVLMSLAPASTFAQSIGVFTVPDGTSCAMTLTPFVSKPLYVLYRGQGGANATGAEYRITGFPGTLGSDFVATLTNAPGSNINLGNAFDGTGHNVAWPSAQPFDANGNLLCATYSMLVINPGLPVANVTLTVERRNPPTNNDYLCPLITDSGFNLVCVVGGNGYVNSANDCTVAVDETTWTGVRNLYR